MSLYGDLPAAKGSENGSSKNTFSAPPPVSRMAPPSLQGIAPPQAMKRTKAAAPAPGVSMPAPPATASQQALPSAGQKLTVGAKAPTTMLISEDDEYDPASPNDFAMVLAERRNQRERAMEEVARAKEAVMSRETTSAPAQEPTGAATVDVRPPVPEAVEEASTMAQGQGAKGTKGGLTAAQKMMQKMGWKSGEGLGKNRQGMATPLVLAATDGGTARIMNASLSDALVAADPTARSADPNATRVVLLKNMVGRGEVDDELEDEVADECEAKYGPVVRVVIFEVVDESFPEEESVRIFVEFKGSAAAERAMKDLNGRFFGGRTVTAAYFDEARYANQEFAPQPGEVPGH